jgi:A/G-specific adenine glycosylase
MAQASFASRIVKWQKEHGRHHLPWQQTKDPYRVWLSEIMLQQTQVTTVIDYYQRFLAKFPTVHHLAQATTDDVFNLWAGLGYYARARHLHACAKAVVQEWQGQFPTDAASLQTLPGIGPSSAAAIAAFCYAERAAILDGNVKRVLTRHFAIDLDITKSATNAMLWSLAQAQVPSPALIKRQGDAMACYTQGMMDLGATVCVRRKPKCQQCPVQRSCKAYVAGNAEHYPVKTRNTGQTRDKPTRDIDLLWLTCGSYTLLEKRSSSGIWGGLWCLPMDITVASRLALGQPVAMASFAHELTHLRMHIKPWRLACPSATPLPPTSSNQRWVSASDLGDYGLPKPVRALLGDGTDG